MNTKSYALCPVSDKKINEQVSRINGVFTVVLIITFISTLSIIPVVVLAADFLLRASDYSRFSLIGNLSKVIVRHLGFNQNLINAGPKIFAAKLGFIISSLIFIFFIFSFIPAAIVLAGMLGLFSFLEAAFGLCVACEIYPFFHSNTEKVP